MAFNVLIVGLFLFIRFITVLVYSEPMVLALKLGLRADSLIALR